ncbi:hypothetical protein LB518_24340 [Mesorhizobium sp. BR1-1-16]|uniref:hypothetical protein n=1 Tax=Mesorhizobium sp. BR1-1-16 TaxID=2876653 RepID=UPI001CCB175D|nr:hypothetical protein [Mesorhizobium sp. BR1-1-16]MBZ9939438.1 hypothetical protein [Mesorhizobium sp. BR1-1-16]
MPFGVEINVRKYVAARDKVALLVIEDPAYSPIFQALERHVAALEVANDPVARARIIASNHKAKD